MHTSTFNSIVLENQPLIKKAKQLNPTGTIIQAGSYSFLNIDDAYIHELFDLLDPTYKAQKPDYFSPEKSIGAHITIMYKEENVQLDVQEIGKKHTFHITELRKVTLNNKEYFVLMVSSPSLCTLRSEYNLPKKPRYKGYAIDFHITVATKDRDA
jgi:hypothetical protein